VAVSPRGRTAGWAFGIVGAAIAEDRFKGANNTPKIGRAAILAVTDTELALLSI